MTTPSNAKAVGSRPTGPGYGLPSRPARVLVVAGACGVVLGGVVAAVTGPLALDKGSWLAAYLVLVCGVAQYAIGQAWARPAEPPHPRVLGWTQVAFWNLGNAAVIGGTFTDIPLLVDIGALLLVVGLGIALRPVRRTAPGTAGLDSMSRLASRAYRGLLLLLLVSIPVGVGLAHLRGGA
jgi:hypothetical protein